MIIKNYNFIDISAISSVRKFSREKSKCKLIEKEFINFFSSVQERLEYLLILEYIVVKIFGNQRDSDVSGQRIKVVSLLVENSRSIVGPEMPKCKQKIFT